MAYINNDTLWDKVRKAAWQMHEHMFIATTVAATCATRGFTENVCIVVNCEYRERVYAEPLECMDAIHIAHGWHVYSGRDNTNSNNRA